MMCKTLRKESSLITRIHCHSRFRTLMYSDSIIYHTDSKTEGMTSATQRNKATAVPLLLSPLSSSSSSSTCSCATSAGCNTNATMIVKLVRVTVNDNNFGEMAKKKKCSHMHFNSIETENCSSTSTSKHGLKCYKQQ